MNPPGGIEARGVMHRGSPCSVSSGNPSPLAGTGSPERSNVDVDGERGIKPLPAMVVVWMKWWSSNASWGKMEEEEGEVWLRNRFHPSLALQTSPRNSDQRRERREERRV